MGILWTVSLDPQLLANLLSNRSNQTGELGPVPGQGAAPRPQLSACVVCEHAEYNHFSAFSPKEEAREGAR